MNSELTTISISSSAIKHNLKEFKKLIGKNTKLMPVVKANAYGHGILEVAKICEKEKTVGGLTVVNLNEALLLRKNKIKKPIQIISFFEFDEEKISEAIKNNIGFPLYNIEQAFILNRVGKWLQKKVIIHLKIDTGTTRVGILPKEISDFVKKIAKFNFLDIQGVFSHFSSSEDNKTQTEQQIAIFDKASQKLISLGITPKIRHIACTAATTLYKKAHFEAVRLGLGTYGLYPSSNTKQRLKLKPALSWHTSIIQVKIVPAKTKIGYSGSFTTKKETKLAILPIGYFDGYSRLFSNKSRVFINGKYCPVRGKICMNLTMVEIPKNCQVKVGDKVEIIGSHVTADELAKLSDTINYEITTKINPLIPRKVI